MIDNTLIEKALNLTWKSMEDMEVIVQEWPCQCSNDTHYINWELSIEKFSYYLLSLEFIEKYLEEIDYENNPDYCDDEYPIWYAYSQFWVAIWEYQSGDEQPLIQLLINIK